MANAAFEADRVVRFDLPQGSVHAGDDERVVLFPVTALAELAREAPPATIEAVGRALGDALGKRVAAGLGGAEGVRGATLEAVITRLAGEAAVLGWGAVSLERWGRAMLLVVERAALPEAMVAGAMASALARATGATGVSCAVVARDGALRLLVSSEAAIERVRRWLADGVSWGDAMTRLNAKNGGAS